jgi:hypothetical protein
MATLLSANLGLPKDGWQRRTVYTGIWKRPVEGPRMQHRLNIGGDGQGDLNGHGSEQRAVLVYHIDSYRHTAAHWRPHLLAVAPGTASRRHGAPLLRPPRNRHRPRHVTPINADDAKSWPHQFAVSSPAGPLPAIYVPRSPRRATGRSPAHSADSQASSADTRRPGRHPPFNRRSNVRHTS